jgi:hypothetical protein
MIIVLTVDVEGMPLKNGNWDYSTVVEGIPLLLGLFDEFGIHSTFFVSSDTAEKATEVLKQIPRRGHEVGCHGYNHQALSLKDQKNQYVTLKKATRTISSLLDLTLAGFRAPFCRIGETTLPVLIKLAYRYDSSVVPSPRIYSRHYYPNAPSEPYTPSLNHIDRVGQSPIIEIPISTLPIVGLPLGLSYLMLFGLGFYKSLLLTLDQEIMTMYLHNYDFYPVPSNAKVSSHFKLPYLRSKEKRIQMFRGLLEFLEARFSPTFVLARETLNRAISEKTATSFADRQNS